MRQSGRIELMDALRGLALCVMVIHHVCYDLAAFCGLPWWIFDNPVWTVLHYATAGLFVMLAGVSSNFSHSNVRRGLKALGIALAFTLVTYWMDMPIWFGVLHLLGLCMVFYGLTQRFWQSLPAWVIPAVTIPLMLLTGPCAEGVPTQTPHLWMFGFTTADFSSADYFPLLPWLFVFLLGTWAGRYIREGRFPRWFYAARAPHLAAVGRKSLWIYVLHQPILYGLVLLGLRLFGK